MSLSLSSVVKLVRQRTGLSLSICKQAVEECYQKTGESGSISRALEIAQQKGLEFQEQLPRDSQSINEGLVGLFENERFFCGLSVSCTTDFVARSLIFQQLLSDVAQCALENSTKSSTLTDHYQNLVIKAAAQCQEPISIRSLQLWPKNEGSIYSQYIHKSLSPYVGSIFALAEFGGDCERNSYMDQIAQQVAGTNPACISDLIKEPLIFDNSQTVGAFLSSKLANHQLLQIHRMSVK